MAGVNKIRQNAIIAAIKELDPKKDFTNTGKPEVKALEAVLGFEVTAEERDAAFEEFKKTPEVKKEEKRKSSIITGEDGLKAIKQARKEKLEKE